MNVQLIIVVVYIALLFAISFYVKSRADKGSAEYLFAGRKLGPVLIAVNITGLAVGAASTVGVAENAYKVGMAAGWYNAAWSAGAIIMGLVAAGKLRAMKVSTIPEFFEKYYDTKGRVISAVGLVIIMSVITALQYLAGGAILASLLPEYFSFRGGMIVSAVVFIGITLIGGLWSSGYYAYRRFVVERFVQYRQRCFDLRGHFIFLRGSGRPQRRHRKHCGAASGRA